jgi:hypothetical protein
MMQAGGSVDVHGEADAPKTWADAYDQGYRTGAELSCDIGCDAMLVELDILAARCGDLERILGTLVDGLLAKNGPAVAEAVDEAQRWLGREPEAPTHG